MQKTMWISFQEIQGYKTLQNKQNDRLHWRGICHITNNPETGNVQDVRN